QKEQDRAPRDWGPLTFEGPAAGAKYDQAGAYASGSRLERVIVEYGQGLFVNGGAPMITHCRIRHNRKERGGGIYAYRCRPLVQHSTLSNNVADDAGGAFRSIYSEPILANNIIAFNSARYDGGGISIDHAVAQIVGNTIRGNVASQG